MNKQSYSFVLWAIPRFHRTGPARVVTATSHDSQDWGSLSSKPRAREEDKAPAITGITGSRPYGAPADGVAPLS